MFSSCHRNATQNNALSPTQTSTDFLAMEHRSRLTHIIDHLVIAQKRAESSGNDAAITFVNEQLKRYLTLNIVSYTANFL